MTNRSIAIGMPCYGQVEAATVTSLAQVLTQGATGYELELLPLATGPYVQHNVAALVRLCQNQHDPDWFLRIDSDMAWSSSWWVLFVDALSRVEEAFGSPRQKALCVGGVYPDRHPERNHPLCYDVRFPKGVPAVFGRYLLAHDSWYLQEFWYEGSGPCLTPAGMLGGGFCAFSRKALQELRDEDFLVTGQVGEDVRMTARIADVGKVLALWPTKLSVLEHGVGGVRFSVGDYLEATKDIQMSPELTMDVRQRLRDWLFGKPLKIPSELWGQFRTRRAEGGEA